jgi:glycosyltransferase 2 family protein
LGRPHCNDPSSLLSSSRQLQLPRSALLLLLLRHGRLGRIASTIQPLVRALRLLLGRSGVLLLSVTLGVWLLEGFNFWLVGHSLDAGVSLVDATFLAVLASFAAAVPSAPGYIGTYDAALVFGLEALDVAGGEAVAFAVLVRFIVFVPITFAGLALLLTRYGGLPRIRLRTSE